MQTRASMHARVQIASARLHGHSHDDLTSPSRARSAPPPRRRARPRPLDGDADERLGSHGRERAAATLEGRTQAHSAPRGRLDGRESRHRHRAAALVDALDEDPARRRRGEEQRIPRRRGRVVCHRVGAASATAHETAKVAPRAAAGSMPPKRSRKRTSPVRGSDIRCARVTVGPPSRWIVMRTGISVA